MKFGSYYQAQVDPAQAWFFVGALRSFEHMAFDRTLDVASSRFEFFVPEDTEKYFLEFMHYFEQQKIVFNVAKMDNRLSDSEAQV